MTSEPALLPLNRLVGTWTTEATHPQFPGVVVRGTAVVEWLTGERFLSQRTAVEHPAFPASTSLIGFTERDRVDDPRGTTPAASTEPEMTMHYFDSRGVFRVYFVGIDDRSWRIWRESPGFSQRFTGTFGEGGDTIVGLWQLRRDDAHWEDDLAITYRREK